MNDNKLIADFMEVDGFLTLPQMHYQESWDWLMPVVEKIGDENLLSIDIDVVYDRVIEFIKEYNDER
jgi:hypothetical protein